MAQSGRSSVAVILLLIKYLRIYYAVWAIKNKAPAEA